MARTVKLSEKIIRLQKKNKTLRERVKELEWELRRLSNAGSIGGLKSVF